MSICEVDFEQGIMGIDKVLYKFGTFANLKYKDTKTNEEVTRFCKIQNAYPDEQIYGSRKNTIEISYRSNPFSKSDFFDRIEKIVMDNVIYAEPTNADGELKPKISYSGNTKINAQVDLDEDKARTKELDEMIAKQREMTIKQNANINPLDTLPAEVIPNVNQQNTTILPNSVTSINNINLRENTNVDPYDYLDEEDEDEENGISVKEVKVIKFNKKKFFTGNLVSLTYKKSNKEEGILNLETKSTIGRLIDITDEEIILDVSKLYKSIIIDIELSNIVNIELIRG